MGFQLPELPQLVSFAGFLVAFDQRNASGAQQGMNLIMAPKDGTAAPHWRSARSVDPPGMIQDDEIYALRIRRDLKSRTLRNTESNPSIGGSNDS